MRPKSAKVVRPQSAKAETLASIRQRPHSALPKHLSKPFQVGKERPVPELSPIESGLQEIVQEEKVRNRGRPTSAISATHRTTFVPSHRASHSPTRSVSPRKDVSRTLSALRREAEGTSFPGRATSSGGGDQVASSLESGLRRVFSAKCIDLQLRPTDERLDRFIQIIRGNSSDGRLCLREGGLGPLAGAAVAAMFVDNPVFFNALDLSGNALKDQGGKAIAEMLSKNSGLMTLDLRSNDIGMEGGISIFDSLLSNASITELDLGILAGSTRNRVGAKVSEAMKRALSGNSSLMSLSLLGNGLGPDGCTQLSKGLGNNTTLRTLDLGLNNIRDEGAIQLAGALEVGSIETLNLASNGIGDTGAVRMSQAIRSGLLLLQSLDLSNNQIGPQAASNLGDALSHNSLLCVLHLDKNEIGPEGGVALSRGIESRSLTHLSLSYNNLHDRGVQHIVQKLRGNTSITRLDLSGNECGDMGAAAVAGMLRINNSLTSLSLEENAISDNGGIAVSHALGGNNTLRTLSVKSNLLHDATGSSFVAGLRMNTGLTELDISWNDINYANYRSIEKLIAEHAARYREGAVPRLKKEMIRLKKEEPKLAIREAELVELNEERERCQIESQRLGREQDETLQYTVAKLEELQAQLADSSQDLADRHSDIKAHGEKFEEEKVKMAGEIGVLQKKLDQLLDNERRMRTELEGIESKIEWEQQDELEQEELITHELQESQELLQRTQNSLEEWKESLQNILDEMALAEQPQESDEAAQSATPSVASPRRGKTAGSPIAGSPMAASTPGPRSPPAGRGASSKALTGGKDDKPSKAKASKTGKGAEK